LFAPSGFGGPEGLRAATFFMPLSCRWSSCAIGAPSMQVNAMSSLCANATEKGVRNHSGRAIVSVRAQSAWPESEI